MIKDSLEETTIGQRIRDEEIIQRLRDETDGSDQKTRDLEKALGIALQTIQRLEKDKFGKIISNETAAVGTYRKNFLTEIINIKKSR